ncbi:MAG: AgmX/PglI C-terminal domain-containing protein [Gammaproteobacteria bacterium]
MSAYYYTVSMPGADRTEDDLRFQRILRNNLIGFLLLGLVIPFLPLPEIERNAVEELPPRLAKLILEQRPVAPPPKPQPVITRPEPVRKQKPKPVPKKVQQPRPVKQVPRSVKKPAAVKPAVSARQQAQQAGLLALKDSLSDLRQNTVATSLKQAQARAHSGGQARRTERAILTAGTTTASGGINTANLSRNTGGGALTARTTTQVHSPVGNAGGGDVQSGSSGKGERRAGRSMEEIQMIFDRNKGSIYSVYNRALRKDPTLQGKVVLRLTIAPAGNVIECELISSELHDPALGQKISQRVKLFNFGSKDVDAVTITYPIDFLPA